MAANEPSLDAWHPDQTLEQMTSRFEKRVLAAALKTAKTQVNAAKMLGINQSTIARKLKKYGLTKPGVAQVGEGPSD